MRERALLALRISARLGVAAIHAAGGPSSASIVRRDTPAGVTFRPKARRPFLRLTLTVAAALFAGLIAVPSVFGVHQSASITQCENGSPTVPHVPACNPQNWITGNLGKNDSHYHENDSVPFRIIFGNLAAGSHTVRIFWDTTKAGKHAYDYVTTFDRTIGTANPCTGVANCVLGSYSAFAIPPDPQVTGAGVTPIAGEFRLFGGGTITGVSAYSYPDGPGFAGNTTAAISINFTSTAANPSPVLAWGGHIASRVDWGPDGGANSIPGSPYHMHVDLLDGESIGHQDLSLSSDAVIFPGSITIIKDAVPNSAQVFSFTAGPSPLTNFTLVDNGIVGPDRMAFTGIHTHPEGTVTFTITEAPVAGWATSISPCTVTSANGGTQIISGSTVTINLADGENVTCTYVNTQTPPGNIQITKTPDQGSVPAGSQIGFTIVVTNPGPTPAVGVFLTDTLPVNPGLNWSIDVPGTTAAGCTIAAGVLTCNIGTLNPGSVQAHIVSPTTTATCGTVNDTATVITANAGLATASASAAVICTQSITIVKDAQPDSSHPFDFFGDLGSFDLVNDGIVLPSQTFNGLQPGTFVVTEATVAGSQLSAISCSDGSPTSVATRTATISLAAGENVTCTFTNLVTAPDMQITKTPDNPSVTAGSAIGFVITVTHPGDPLTSVPANNVVVTDTLPTNPGLAWTIDVAGSDSGCSITAGVLTCNFGSLPPNSARHVHIVSPTTTATCGGVNNTATLTSDHGTGSASASITVVCPGTPTVVPGTATPTRTATPTATSTPTPPQPPIIVTRPPNIAGAFAALVGRGPTATPVVALPIAPPPAPLLRPPSTGDAGLLTDLDALTDE